MRQPVHSWKYGSACALMIVAVGLSRLALAADERSGLPDSYKYYGPGGLWKAWNPEQRLGRDTWLFWTWGNQKLFREFSRLTGRSPVPISFDFLRMLDTRRRKDRFKDLGLINEPNCSEGAEDAYGFYLDKFNKDPLEYYPGRNDYDKDQPKTPQGTLYYGEPAGVVGLRIFPNESLEYKQKFEERWKNGSLKAKDYFADPANIEPPYVVGLSCAFCHIAFDPLNPPKDPANPRWENLASNVGNQYFKEGELFLGKGRVIMGNLNPGPNHAKDPYDTKGLTERDFLNHYATTQQPGTSETSRISYDFINNPNTINPIFQLYKRPTFEEVLPNGKRYKVMHILKDGADSVGAFWAFMRVPVNIGCQGDYWVHHLFNPVSGRHQRPVAIIEMLASLPDAEKKKLEEEYGFNFAELTNEKKNELEQQFGKEFGTDWNEAYFRAKPMMEFLSTYKKCRLQDAPGGTAFLKADNEQLKRGALVFAKNCAICHSSRQLPPTLDTHEKKIAYFSEEIVKAPFPDAFLEDDYLSDDKRYPVTYIGTNMARALATNAVEGDIWAEFSSKDYKTLKPLGRINLSVPVFDPKNKAPIKVDFFPPGGGRGYYRTPSLVGMWATAPYLHNNSVGEYTDDPSVAARVAAFEDGIGRLLRAPGKNRLYTIKRTSADSYLIPDFQNVFSRASRTVAKAALEKLKGKIEAHAFHALEEGLKAASEDLAKVLKDGETREVVQGLLRRLIAQRFQELAEQFKSEDKAVLQLLGDLERRAGMAIEMSLLKVPKGTPVNLFLNLSPSKLPYALVAMARYGDQPEALAEALLNLSDCPDLVEDKGHVFGHDFKDPITGTKLPDMSDQEKLDLIEYLKRL